MSFQVLLSGSHAEICGKGTRKADTEVSLDDGLSEAKSTTLISPPILSTLPPQSGKVPHPFRIPFPAPSTSSLISRARPGPNPQEGLLTNRVPRIYKLLYGLIDLCIEIRVDQPGPTRRSIRSTDLNPPLANNASPATKRKECRSSRTASFWGMGECWFHLVRSIEKGWTEG